MSQTRSLLNAYPRGFDVDSDLIAQCAEACAQCSQACTGCAEACLSEAGVAELVSCIRTDLNCADVCAATGRLLLRHSPDDIAGTRAVVGACAVLCAACAEECEAHAEMHEHCRICAEACRACEQACRALLDALDR